MGETRKERRYHGEKFIESFKLAVKKMFKRGRADKCKKLNAS